MECFIHPGVSAAAVCRTCGKGACRACAIEVTRGVACSQNCVSYAEALAELQDQTVRSIRNFRAQRFTQPLIGLVSLCFGGYALVDGTWGFAPLVFLAMGVIVVGSWLLSRQRSPPLSASGAKSN